MSKLLTTLELYSIIKGKWSIKADVKKLKINELSVYNLLVRIKELVQDYIIAWKTCFLLIQPNRHFLNCSMEMKK